MEQDLHTLVGAGLFYKSPALLRAGIVDADDARHFQRNAANDIKDFIFDLKAGYHDGNDRFFLAHGV
jgi:hypothetical protein